MQAKEVQLSFVIKSLGKITDPDRFCLEVCKILKEPKTYIIKVVLKHVSREVAL